MTKKQPNPQSDDTEDKRLSFWTDLDQEVVSALNEGCFLIIQMDANSKVGREVIPKNPQEIVDKNGEDLINLIERHGLKMLNADPRCRGTITRHRVTINGIEESILDYVIVCEPLYCFFDMMKIDEERCNPLTNYSSKKSKGKRISSDHNIILTKFNL